MDSGGTPSMDHRLLHYPCASCVRDRPSKWSPSPNITDGAENRCSHSRSRDGIPVGSCAVHGSRTSGFSHSHERHAALKRNNQSLIGLDLRACSTELIIQRLFAAAERHGGPLADAMCQGIRGRAGLALYMDRDRLDAWDGTTIPIVTAIADPSRTLPVQLRAYRSATRIISISRDSTVGGPLLVVLPTLHPNAYRGRANERATVVSRGRAVENSRASSSQHPTRGQP